MDSDELWATVDAQRTSLADLLAGLTPEEWATPSWCAGWRVRDVAAHLALAQVPLAVVLPALLRARGSFDRMVHDTAVARAAATPEELVEAIRAMIGSRRHATVTTEVEPLLDVLVHGQDIARPLGRDRAVPPAAASTAATRAWRMGWPFWARRRLRGLRLVATDSDWRAGTGVEVTGSTGDLLLLVTGRRQVVTDLAGPGLERLTSASSGCS
jgi:uncharacterized protein (TIGR03083 family)